MTDITNLIVFHRLAEDDRTNWRDSQGFLNHTLHVLKFPKRLERYLIVGSVHLTDFLDHSVLNVLVLSQKQKTVRGCRG